MLARLFWQLKFQIFLFYILQIAWRHLGDILFQEEALVIERLRFNERYNLV